MKEVNYSEFHSHIGNKNIKTSISDRFPYTCCFKLNGVTIGKKVDERQGGRLTAKYYLND